MPHINLERIMSEVENSLELESLVKKEHRLL